jgi:hypothetical protein
MTDAQRIALIAPDDPILDEFRAAVAALDAQAAPRADREHHLRIDDDLLIDFSQQIDLNDAGRRPVDSFIEHYDISDVMAVLVLFENADEKRLKSVQSLVAALRIRAPHLPVYFAIPDDPDESREDEIRLACDMMVDEDPLFLFTVLNADTVRELLMGLLEEVRTVNEDYATEANNILDILLDYEE